MYLNIIIFIHINMYIYKHVCIYIYTYTDIHKYTYTYLPNTPNTDTDFRALKSFKVHNGYNINEDNKPMTAFLFSYITGGTPIYIKKKVLISFCIHI
jgi:ABC-type oligopeptide transport system ATPase subunit